MISNNNTNKMAKFVCHCEVEKLRRAVATLQRTLAEH